ncbi:MAG TPA: class I SAM-dependent methyltransferase [Anaerolineales bacterium]|nr:class I SAM-dependent methyltransferase [Anaerolineales bacterium]
MPGRDNIDLLKKQPDVSARLRYALRNANVYVSRGGYHFIDTLDPIESISPEIDSSQLTETEAAYVETHLHANVGKFKHQVDVLKKHLRVENANVLDIGCGGGLFLSLLRQEGANVTGIELSDSRAHYAASRYNLEIHKRPIESDFWQKGYVAYFDAVTLWDVIEHVNYPFETLQCAVNLLKPGGLLLIDTPSRDSFYHQVGELTYRISGGSFPTFLNAMYSAHLFGHKQIFSTTEMKELLEAVGLSVIELRKFHELSFPYEFYLKKMLRVERLVKVLLPAVKAFFWLFKIRNKMLVIGKKS